MDYAEDPVWRAASSRLSLRPLMDERRQHVTLQLHTATQSFSAFYEGIAAEFDEIADRLFSTGAGSTDWQRELRSKAVEIRAGAGGIAVRLASIAAPADDR